MVSDKRNERNRNTMEFIRQGGMLDDDPLDVSEEEMDVIIAEYVNLTLNEGQSPKKAIQTISLDMIKGEDQIIDRINSIIQPRLGNYKYYEGD